MAEHNADKAKLKKENEALRKRAEALEHEVATVTGMAESYRAIFNAATDAVLILDLYGNIVDVNPQACVMYGYTHEEFIRLKARDLVHPDFYSLFKEYEQGNKPDYAMFPRESVDVTKDGILLNVEVRVSEFDYRGDKHILAIVRDVSERKQAERERERLKAQLLQDQKVKAIGTLAAGVYHEINNPLNLIIGFSSLLLSQAEPGTSSHRDLEKIVRQAENCRRIVENLLRFVRNREIVITAVDINSCVREALDVVHPQLVVNNIRLEQRVDPGVPSVQGDYNQLQQVFVNLLTNAAQAMPQGGVLSVTTGKRNDEQVHVAIADTGPGIREEDLPYIFEPFFTTRSSQEGTGMGLAVSQGIISVHGGEITCTTRRGQDTTEENSSGTTFTVRLPIPEKRE